MQWIAEEAGGSHRKVPGLDAGEGVWVRFPTQPGSRLGVQLGHAQLRNAPPARGPEAH